MVTEYSKYMDLPISERLTEIVRSDFGHKPQSSVDLRYLERSKIVFSLP